MKLLINFTDVKIVTYITCVQVLCQESKYIFKVQYRTLVVWCINWFSVYM